MTSKFNVTHQFADDTQIYLELDQRNANSIIRELEKTIIEFGQFKPWVTNNKLKLTPNKTEFILISDERKQTCSGKFLY